MIIAVCCKFTPDTEDIIVSEDGKVNAARANWSVSEYDLQAIEAAKDISREGDEVIAITAGTSYISQSKLTKALMSRGNLSKLYRIADDSLKDADSLGTAKVLAKAIQNVNADLVLFGEGSSDRYSRTMGSMVGEILGWPSVNYVDEITFDGDIVTAERDLEDGVEIVSVELPCTLSVTSTINVPSLPMMKAILGAGKKPVEDLSAADAGIDLTPSIELVASELPAQPGRQQIILEGDADEVAGKLVSALRTDQLV
ncbi:MAG: electron transfer flavoprotein [Eggerthellaceae bacterium]|nr:electron transfer flavoprotein [Eggerthellaceae bacterium]